MKNPAPLLFDFLLFGGSGDLALRKLIPALYLRFKDEKFHPDTRIIALSRSEQSHETYRSDVKKALQTHLKSGEWNEACWPDFSRHLSFEPVDAFNSEGFKRLNAILGNDDDRPRVYYLSTHSSLYTQIVQQLADSHLITENSRLVIEKPIGRDLRSAQAINQAVGSVFSENQIYRIDHYLGKETVQNLLVLRFANPLFESLWDHHYIDHIQISIAEAIGVEGRSEFYESTGALRDIVQNHLLQLLCIVGMESPSKLDPDRIRDEKLKVLRSLKPMDNQAISKDVVRGQYTSGLSEGNKVPGYLEESGIPDDSNTESFVAMKVEIQNMRWAGVPFYLRTGKRLPERLCEIVVQFKEIPHSIFNMSASQLLSNQLIITLQPNESITLRLCGKRFGPGMEVRTIDLNLSPDVRAGRKASDAYERLIFDVINGDPTLFLRQDELEEAWAWVEPILNHWGKTSAPPDPYAAGSWGPSAATLMLARDGKLWREGSR